MKIYKFNSIEDVDKDHWNLFVDSSVVSLDIEHLRAVEESAINDIQPVYFMGYKDGMPQGIAYGFILRMNFARMAATYPKEVLDSVMEWQNNFMNIKILEVGHIASLGNTIACSETHQEEFMGLLSTEIDRHGEEHDVDLCLIRDIPHDKKHRYDGFSMKGFLSVMGFPIAQIPLKWNSFQGYLDALKSKKRNQIKATRKKMLHPEISVEIIEDYGKHAPRLAELWRLVAQANNGYEHEQLSPEYFRSMARNLRGKSHVVAIKRFDEIIAYGLNLIGEKEYFGMAEGLDYRYRDIYDLYGNNILEGLRVAAMLGKERYNIGVTTYDYKCSLGAELQPVYYMVKAMKNGAATRVYSNWITQGIEQPENKHRAFREVGPTVMSPRDLQRRLDPSDSVDPFQNLLLNNRANEARTSRVYSYFPAFEGAQNSTVRHQGKEVIMLGTNSYMGLSTHPRVESAMVKAIEHYGSGCSGSPLLNGTLDLHDNLSRQLAEFCGKESALLYSTGYQANLGLLSALVGPGSLIFMDRRNHASLVDGAKLSGARILRYRHNDMQSLEKLLRGNLHKPKLVVTDSVFSMEGTMVNLPEMVDLCEKYQARLMLDESHAIGVYGPGGAGVAQHYGLSDRVDVIMGTFSKSLASVGGFGAADAKIVDGLRHVSRSHIFSASLPPACVASVSAALSIIEEEPQRRQRLLENASYLADGLEELGYELLNRQGAILPLFCGNELLALAAYKKLLEMGVFVNPVVWPAVPKGQEILRISLMATHSKAELDRALSVFYALRTAQWPVNQKEKKGVLYDTDQRIVS